MNDAVCPYCRGQLNEATASLTICLACGTPHHADCFEENAGCTVFGCSAAPPAEPKLSIGAVELHSPAPSQAPAANPVPPPPPPPGAVVVAPPLFGSTGYATSAPVAMRVASQTREIDLLNPDFEASAKNRTTFIVLGALLGWTGAHSFYAGSIKKGVVQLCITVFTLGMAGMMVWIWAIIDICTISNDGHGIPFRS